MFKKLIAFSLAVVWTAGFIPFSSATESEAKLYDIYSSNMLFQQNKDAVISGTAPGNSKIKAELFNKNNILVASGESVASGGIFSVSFPSPSGGYDEYSVIMKCNGKEFAKLSNVVFGELWIASGQSNMMYPLAQDKDGREKFANGEPLNKNVRVMLIPDYPEYKGSKELLPADPQNDIVNAKWVTGENGNVYSMSAVAYYFADETQKKLNVPVGILNVSLGGTILASWLSRDAIDGCDKVKNYLLDCDKYIKKSDWKEDSQNVYGDMTVNFNQRIAPLKGFRPVGMIWYQGESDLMANMSSEYYADAMALMQSSYADYFDYDGNMLPAIFTQIASYPYNGDLTQPAKWNIGYTEMQEKNADSQAMVTVYDIPTHFLPEVGLIHPENKKEIGERMAFAASGLVYGKKETFTAATVKSHEIKDGSIFITFNNTGDGLVANGNKLLGFAVCGDNGIYVQADAEIISKDTVRISSEYVPDPKSATYAYCLSNIRSNLFATENGNIALPVAPFVTDLAYDAHFWADKSWADCEDELIWHNIDDSDVKYRNSWVAKNASIIFADGLSISAEKKNFSVSPAFSYSKNSKDISFADFDSNYSDYGKMTFRIRNNGSTDIYSDGIKIYTNAITWYSPAVNNTNEPSFVIPADGEWHTVTLNLNKLYFYGNECGITFGCNKLKNVRNIDFCFSGENANINIDEIRFAPLTEKDGVRFEAEIKNADGVGEFLSALFVGFIGIFANLFI